MEIESNTSAWMSTSINHDGEVGHVSIRSLRSQGSSMFAAYSVMFENDHFDDSNAVEKLCDRRATTRNDLMYDGRLRSVYPHCNRSLHLYHANRQLQATGFHYRLP